MSDWFTILEYRGPNDPSISYIPGVGIQGPKGDTGAAGPTGPAGADGNDGAKGLQWRGTYSSGTTYTLDDACSYNGSSYISLQANNLNHQPDISGSYWELLASKGDTGATGAAGADGADGADGTDGATGAQGPAGLNWLPAGWSNIVSYNVDDAVSHNGSSYVCILSHTNQEPPNGTYWDVLASKGDTGAAGTTDHGSLTGLSDDDHSQYHNDARGDARYYTETELDAGQLDNRYYTETEVNTLLDHGGLTGLTDDDHTQYHNDTRGDARYYTQTQLNGGQLDSLYADITAGVPSTGADNTVLKRTGVGATDWSFAKQEAVDVDTNITNFNLSNGALSASDINIQAALETLNTFTDTVTSSLSFLTSYNPDRPPSGLYASSDEFNGSISGSWAWGNQGAATDTATLDGALLNAVDASTHATDGLNCRFLAAPPGTTNFVVTLKASMNATQGGVTPTAGLVFMVGTPGTPTELHTLALCETATNGSSIKVDNLTSYNGTITAKSALSNVVTSWGMFVTRPIYYQIIYLHSTTEVFNFFSHDGIVWYALGNYALTGRPDYIGRFVDANQSSGSSIPSQFSYWFRTMDNTTSQICGS